MNKTTTKTIMIAAAVSLAIAWAANNVDAVGKITGEGGFF